MASAQSCIAEGIRPPSGSFSPSLWTDTFAVLSSSLINDQACMVREKYAKEIEVLKEEARSLLASKRGTKTEKLVLIDTLERLGVAYHFENEIEEQLRQIYNDFKSDHHVDYNDDYSELFATALQFRLFRQLQRYHVSCDVFDKFKDQDTNKFKDALIADVKGLLSLYEASQLRIHEEYILDEAADFTKYHLNRVMMQLESPLKDQVHRALQHSFHRSIPRVETLYYIPIYELMDCSANNEKLLRLAKLDFNFLQNIHKKELYDLCTWWNELDLKSKLPYGRDRIVESYVWGMAHHFEPQYSFSRISTAKGVQLMTTLDDTYDNYATLQEAEVLTEVLQRWDANEIDNLPDYMKILYRFILDVYEDYEREAAEHGKEFVIPYVKESLKLVSRAYYKEMKWFKGREKPTFDEYLSSVLVKISGIKMLHAPFTIGLESVSEETMDWLVTEPNKMADAASKAGRFLNDLASYQREKENGQMSMAVNCYMKQHGVSKEEVGRKFHEFIDAEWKDLNAEWLANAWIPKQFAVLFLNFARAAEITYRNSADGFTSPESSFAPLIRALFVKPIVI